MKKPHANPEALTKAGSNRNPITPEVIEQIIELLEEGFSLRQSCTKLGIRRSTLHAKCHEDPELAARILEARRTGFDAWEDEILRISDTSGDARLQVDSRKWLLSKLRPDKYGDVSKTSVDLNVSGSVKHEFKTEEEALEYLRSKQAKK